MTAVNVPLLRKVLEHITEHPDEHDQGVWAVTTPCGTVACLAGHAVAMSGGEFVWQYPVPAEVRQFGATQSASFVAETGRPVSHVAQQLLGLSDEEAGDLFHAENLDELWLLVDEITDGEIQRPVTM